MGYGRQILWYVVLVDSAAPSRKSAGSVCVCETAAANGADCKLIDLEIYFLMDSFFNKKFLKIRVPPFLAPKIFN